MRFMNTCIFLFFFSFLFLILNDMDLSMGLAVEFNHLALILCIYMYFICFEKKKRTLKLNYCRASLGAKRPFPFKLSSVSYF